MSLSQQMNITPVALTLDAVGEEKDVRDLTDLAVQLFLDGGSGAVTIEGTIDGVHWAAVTAAITTNSIVAITIQSLKKIRAKFTTAITGSGGAPTVYLGARTDRD